MANTPSSDALVEALRDELAEADGAEINPNNYGHDDVCLLNDRYVAAFQVAERAIEALALRQSPPLSNLRICKICDGGPANECTCSCGLEAWETPLPDAAMRVDEVAQIIDPQGWESRARFLDQASEEKWRRMHPEERVAQEWRVSSYRLADEAVESSRGKARKILAALSPSPAVQPDPDLGKIERGHVCKHGVRWPHPCEPCDEAAWAAPQ